METRNVTNLKSFRFNHARHVHWLLISFQIRVYARSSAHWTQGVAADDKRATLQVSIRKLRCITNLYAILYWNFIRIYVFVHQQNVNNNTKISYISTAVYLSTDILDLWQFVCNERYKLPNRATEPPSRRAANQPSTDPNNAVSLTWSIRHTCLYTYTFTLVYRYNCIWVYSLSLLTCWIEYRFLSLALCL